MNAIFICIFNQRQYLDMALLLLDSIDRYGELGEDTEILIYTTSEFMEVIRGSRFMSEKIRFEINDGYNDVAAASKSRLDLFDLASVARYDKILYLDTDVIVKNDVHRVFDLVTRDVLYALGEGSIDDPTDIWGASLFGSEVESYPDKTAFCAGVLAFPNCNPVRRLFDAIRADMVARPGDFACLDQPYFVYNAFKYRCIDNQQMTMVAVNDCDSFYSNLVIHHFPGGPGVAAPKISKMQKLLHGINGWRGGGRASSPTAAMTVLARRAMLRRLQEAKVGSGSITLPAVPALLEDYVSLCDQTFRATGTHGHGGQLEYLRELIAKRLELAYANAPRSAITIDYQMEEGGLSYSIHSRWRLAGDRFARYGDTPDEPPVDGAEPDARVWALAEEIDDAAAGPVLTVGGRNSVPLARRGHPVVAVAPRAADELRQTAEHESLDLRVVEGDLFAVAGSLGPGYRLMALCGVVSQFEDPAQLRALFELAAGRLVRGGPLVFNIFLGRLGYEPDAAVREFGSQIGSTPFSYAEVAAAAEGLPLELVADDSVLEFEQAHCPVGSWPPDPWYVDWVTGLDLFEVAPEESPIEMRWLVYRRTD